MSTVQDVSPEDMAIPSDLSVAIPATNACGCSVGHVADDKPAALFVAFVVTLFLRRKTAKARSPVG